MVNDTEHYTQQHLRNPKYHREFHLERVGKCDLVCTGLPDLEMDLIYKSTHKILKIQTPQKSYRLTTEQCAQNMQTEWQTV